MSHELPGPGNKPPSLSADAETVLLAAGEEARKLGRDRTGTEHLLLALLRQGGIVDQIFLDLQVTAAVVRKRISERYAVTPETTGGLRTPHLEEALRYSVEEARLMGCAEDADCVHLLLGITRIPTCTAVIILDLMTLSPKEVREAVFFNLAEKDLLPEKILERNGLA